MIQSYDYLGGAAYRKLVLREHPQGRGSGVFAVEFNKGKETGYRFSADLINTGRTPLHRVQLIWDKTHRYGDSYIRQLKKLAKQFNKLAVENKGVSIILSPFCEYNGSIKIDKYIEIVQHEAPDCTVIASPQPNVGKLSTKYLNEVHGNDSRKNVFGFSYDGLNSVDADHEKFKKDHSSATFFMNWHPAFNCHWNMTYSKRDARPSVELIDSLIYMEESKGDCKLPAGWIAKSHAEKHGAADTKGWHLCIITPANFKPSNIVLKTGNGQTVDTLRFVGSYNEKPSGKLLGWRYYGAWGYQTGLKAKRIQGHPVVRVIANKKQWGKINPGFRQNAYRNKNK